MTFREKFSELAAEQFLYQPGALNAITDVPGVQVGHLTLSDPSQKIATGVTAIWPNRDIYQKRYFAGGHVLHGTGEMTGLLQVQEWGVIETPIVLCPSLMVGRAHSAIVRLMCDENPGIGADEDVVLPVVAECDDSFLNSARNFVITEDQIVQTLKKCTGSDSEKILQGSVGAGTGMIAFDYKGGIGTASRRVKVAGKAASELAGKTDEREFIVGALLNANFGFARQLRVAGQRVGLGASVDRGTGARGLPLELKKFAGRPITKERSVIVVLATNAPLRPDQIRRLCVRATLALGRVGSFAGHGSGEIVIGFSTANSNQRVKADEAPVSVTHEFLHDSHLNSFYEATVEAVEEAVYNALFSQ